MIAVVQSFLIRALIINRIEPHSVTEPQRRLHLIEALSDILWGCGNGSSATILCPFDLSEARSARNMRPYVYYTKSSLKTGIAEQHFALLMAASGPGLAAFLFSCAYTRGVHWIQKSDMDYPQSTLIAEHGYCAQELVNLMVFGRACSNVFDGNKFVGQARDGEAKLQGVPKRAMVGLLTLYEARNDWVEVGSYLKSPIHPVWIICAESHYSVLFAPHVADTSDAAFRDGRPFDLYYFDMLAQQREMYSSFHNIRMYVGV